MSRRRAAKKREVLNDPKYGDKIISKLVNYVMLDGKKSVAENIVYESLDGLSKLAKKDPIEAFHEALSNVKPTVEVRSRRIGGATYQIPVEVRAERSLALALRWLVTMARGRNEKTMVEKLGNELFDAFNNKGNAIKKKDDIHRMAEANRAFAHYRW
ncbi:30S ribosomal protein S7 [Rickettsiales bacterium LUAb2]